MNLSIIATIAYGLLALAGGIMGYVKVKSQASLISGTVSGILLILAAIASLNGQAWGIFVAAAITVVLIIVFVIRFLKTRKFMPAGLMIVAGIPTFALIFSQLF
ncbi:MAG: TMEM14 family protein [Cyanobacteriota bacterium]|nr:TMEM14 family protein [Cyanobacteriota bacterium]